MPNKVVKKKIAKCFALSNEGGNLLKFCEWFLQYSGDANTISREWSKPL